MKIMRWAALMVLLASCSALTYAQVDGGIGLHGSTNSLAITSLSELDLGFTSCAGVMSGNPLFADCNTVFGGPVQYVFGGYNQTGFAWNSLSLTFTDTNSMDFPIFCSVAPTFLVSNCASGLAFSNGGTVTLNLIEGNGGMGISCYANSDSSDPPVNGGANNAACLVTSALFGALDAANPSLNLPYLNNLANPLASTCTNGNTVCGGDSFVIGIGTPGKTFENPPTEFSLNADPTLVPEPQTLLLVGSAVLGMALLAKKRLVA